MSSHKASTYYYTTVSYFSHSSLRIHNRQRESHDTQSKPPYHTNHHANKVPIMYVRTVQAIVLYMLSPCIQLKIENKRHNIVPNTSYGLSKLAPKTGLILKNNTHKPTLFSSENREHLGPKAISDLSTPYCSTINSY